MIDVCDTIHIPNQMSLIKNTFSVKNEEMTAVSVRRKARYKQQGAKRAGVCFTCLNTIPEGFGLETRLRSNQNSLQ